MVQPATNGSIAATRENRLAALVAHPEIQRSGHQEDDARRTRQIRESRHDAGGDRGFHAILIRRTLGQKHRREHQRRIRQLGNQRRAEHQHVRIHGDQRHQHPGSPVRDSQSRKHPQQLQHDGGKREPGDPRGDRQVVRKLGANVPGEGEQQRVKRRILGLRRFSREDFRCGSRRRPRAIWRRRSKGCRRGDRQSAEGRCCATGTPRRAPATSAETSTQGGDSRHNQSNLEYRRNSAEPIGSNGFCVHNRASCRGRGRRPSCHT